MSMIGNFRMASDPDIANLLAEPETIVELLYPESEETMKGVEELDLDKAWHGIHYLLCDSPWEGMHPLNFVVSGGAPVGDVDVGYGPARVYTSSEVAEIAKALEPISKESLRKKFDPKDFFENEIYPEIWDEPIEECLDTYVLSYFEDLKAFVIKAQDESKGLIVYLN